MRVALIIGRRISSAWRTHFTWPNREIEFLRNRDDQSIEVCTPLPLWCCRIAVGLRYVDETAHLRQSHVYSEQYFVARASRRAIRASNTPLSECSAVLKTNDRMMFIEIQVQGTQNSGLHKVGQRTLKRAGKRSVP